MGDLSKMSDSAKVAFLMEALIDVAETLRRMGYEEGARYINYVREMRGEKKEASHG